MLWAKVGRIRGSKFVMGVSAIFTACEMLILSFITSQNSYLLILSNIMLGIGLGGFFVSLFTYRYEIMPEEERTVYEGWFYFASGLGMLIAPFAGNMLMKYLPQFSNIIFENSKIQLLYLTSFILLCILLLFSFAKKKGTYLDV